MVSPLMAFQLPDVLVVSVVGRSVTPVTLCPLMSEPPVMLQSLLSLLPRTRVPSA